MTPMSPPGMSAKAPLRAAAADGGARIRNILTAPGAAALALDPPAARSGSVDPQTLAARLLARGAVRASDVSAALEAQRDLDLPLGDILLARGVLTEVDLASALAESHGLGLSDLATRKLNTRLAHLLPAADALQLDAVPTDRSGAVIVIATSRPDNVAAIRAVLPHGFRPIITVAPQAQIVAGQIRIYGTDLARLAEGQAPLRDSCRTWRPGKAARILLLAAASIGLIAAALPALGIGIVFALALTIFAANMVLKAAAFAAALRAARLAAATPAPSATVVPLHPPARGSDALPVVSLIVPLYREREIASTLVAHLSLLDYPRERLDVLLAVEEDDATTRAALSATRLPPWFKVITVPPGHPRTKPRALNFALNFARGDIIGIYDAEDRPDPDQITRIAARFAERPPEVACLQGRLDYYNARHNLMSRLFAIEYANWFRVLLPGVQQLGLVVPLGGTTVFLRRNALLAVGGWDAHNVTEDAELGLRLARRGYRTELVETTTYEEANAAVLPWIRQRTRWQKGYLMTWAMAMRDPAALWRDLGTLRFAALQAQMLGAVAGFLVAPLLWSLMVKPFGLPHPLDALVGPMGYGLMAVAFVASFVLSVALSVHATRAAHLRHLAPWIALSEVYFLLATVSAWRAAVEMLIHPFWWAKTPHGRYGGLAALATGAGSQAPPKLAAASAPEFRPAPTVRAPGSAPAKAPRGRAASREVTLAFLSSAPILPITPGGSAHLP